MKAICNLSTFAHNHLTFMIDEQTVQDLEFDKIVEQLSQFTKGKTAFNRALELRPMSDFEKVKVELGKVAEYQAIRELEEPFPAIDFVELTEELKMLRRENAHLSQDGFSAIRHAQWLVNRVIDFLSNRSTRYPHLAALIEGMERDELITQLINAVFDAKGQILDDASQELFAIRSRLKELRRKINANFDRLLRKLAKEQVLADTKETFLNERRVLSIVASYRKSVEGQVMGASKSGAILFIEPSVNAALNHEYELLQEDERKEIRRILVHLTRLLQPFSPLLQQYQNLLVELDFQYAKMKLAEFYEARCPSISMEGEMELIDARHPLLWKSNMLQRKTTHAQRIKMDVFHRMLVISGPNAGGKSITLKTVGLLQIMAQSGLLVPVQANSKMRMFQRVLTDIGDNQSIENELSTYSYRLKRMKQFLELANKRTLLLMDEFGTGSDPDLGGALAEAFFEELYNKKTFGVITTHYANIKLKADQLRNAVNGCMLFDAESLQPLYRLVVGQPGSSFTFEVAQMNGIPNEILDKAREKISDDKLKMDELLSGLQREKSHFETLNQAHREAQLAALEAQERMESARQKFENKSAGLHSTIEKNNTLLRWGTKMEAFLKRFNHRSRKKGINEALLEEIHQFLKKEKAKLDPQPVVKSVAMATQKNKSQKAKMAQQKEVHHQDKIRVGSQVRLISNRKSGVVESIDGNTATVLFGFIRMKVELNKLSFLQ